jgi:3-hydroxyisobutyrate dehydrogenase-like beta-hydroxyacid dehydrogenase
MSNAKTVGFIGLGAMGGPMAANVLKAGFNLVVHDIDPAKVKTLVAAGAEDGGSASEVARRSDPTICMVETTAQAEAVIMGEDGIAAGADPGQIVVCMSTVAPLAVKQMHDDLAARGIVLFDAPVSGGTPKAADGTLSIIAGGDKAAFEACRTVFDTMAANLFHVGEVGQGLAMKLVNNLLIQVNTVAVAEALVLGAKAGLDPQTMYDIISVSTGNSFALHHRAPRMLSGDFEPGGTIDISYKDQELQTSLAKQLGVSLPLTNMSQQIYEMARGEGLNKQDGAAVVKLFERWAGVELGPR